MRNLIDYTENYLKHPFENYQIFYRKKRIIELLNSIVHRNILEIGCGTDPFFKFYDDFNKLVIIEPSINFYENAIQEVIKNNLNDRVVLINDFFENSVNRIQKPNFDIVIISCLLHEIEDLSIFLETLQCLIQPNTIIHIDVPNANSFHRILAFEMGIIDTIFELSNNNLRFQQQKVFDIETLSNIITNHKFKIINSGTYFIKPFTHKQMSDLIENEIINKTVLDGLYKMIKYMPNLGSELFIEFKIND
ncbi:MAG: class I SAM-dependent methyltransferase [Bacteroidota bacterium]